MRAVRLVPLALAALALTACGTAPGTPRDAASEPARGATSEAGRGAASAPVAPSSRPPFRTTTPGPIGPSGTATEVPEARWAAIAADLAARGIEGEPELMSAERVTFSDGSLGCPRPGRSYTQALVDGMRVVVTAGGERHDYRFGGDDTPRLCPDR